MKSTGIALALCGGLGLTGALALGAAAPSLPTAAVLASEAQQTLVFINDARADSRYRAETGGAAAPLRWNAAAAEAARRHSEEMARAGRLSHADAAGSNPGVRLTQAGVVWSQVGENVAMAPTIEQAENIMMREPAFQANHRANVLDRHFTEIGIGIAAIGDELYVTEDFLTP